METETLVESVASEATTKILKAVDLDADATNVTQKRKHAPTDSGDETESAVKDDKKIKRVHSPNWKAIDFNKVNVADLAILQTKYGNAIKNKHTNRDVLILTPPVRIGWSHIREKGDLGRTDWSQSESDAKIKALFKSFSDQDRPIEGSDSDDVYQRKLNSYQRVKDAQDKFKTLMEEVYDMTSRHLFNEHGKKATASAEKWAERQKKKGKEVTADEIQAKAFAIFKSDSVNMPLSKTATGEYSFIPDSKAFTVEDWNVPEDQRVLVPRKLTFYDAKYKHIDEEGFSLGNGAIIAAVIKPAITSMPAGNKFNLKLRLTCDFVVYNKGNVSSNTEIPREQLADISRPYNLITKEQNGDMWCYVNDANGSQYKFELRGTIADYDMTTSMGRYKDITEKNACLEGTVEITDSAMLTHVETLVEKCKEHVLKDNSLHSTAKARWREKAASMGLEGEELEEEYIEKCMSDFNSPFKTPNSVKIKMNEYETSNQGFKQVFLAVQDEETGETTPESMIQRDTHVKVVVQPKVWCIAGTGAWGIKLAISRLKDTTYPILASHTASEDQEGELYDL